MTATSSKVRSETTNPKKRLGLSLQQREKLITWIVEAIPNTFDYIFQWLGARPLFLLIMSLLLLLTPLMTARPGIWQQGFVAAMLIATRRLVLQMEEQQPKKKVSEFLHSTNN